MIKLYWALADSVTDFLKQITLNKFPSKASKYALSFQMTLMEGNYWDETNVFDH